MYKTSQYIFPDSEVSMVYQNGSRTAANKGLEVVLYTRENQRDPFCAELSSKDYDANIGFTFEGRKLTDFDGAFFLPFEVAELLRTLGYEVSEDCLA